MLDTIYANKINKNQINESSIIYYFKSDNKVIGIVSSEELSLNGTIVLYTATNHRFLGYLIEIEKPKKLTNIIYYVCD